MAFNRGIVVFSGGTAANSLVDVFNTIRESKNCPLSYVIPISDNGGSSSELIRVFGGPGIGDVRSMCRPTPNHTSKHHTDLKSGRLVRLIPTQPASVERTAIANLFNHRLSSTSSSTAASEWQSLIAGTSPFWTSIPSSKKQLIRSFLNLLNLEILKRSRPPTSTFDFTSASVGNLFLTGARLFSGSFESAIYLLGRITGVPDDVIHVIPAINSNFTHHIAAGLADGSVILGQNSISHPSQPSALESRSSTTTEDSSQEEEDGNLPCSHPTLRQSSIKFSKTPHLNDSNTNTPDLPSRITRIWYINPYGQEIHPPPNPRVPAALLASQAIIYSIGSLYTSIIPSLILAGIGDAIRHAPAATGRKILILNGSLDREVGPRVRSDDDDNSHNNDKDDDNNNTEEMAEEKAEDTATAPFTATDFAHAIVRAGEESAGRAWTKPRAGAGAGVSSPQQSTATTRALYHSYITHLLHLSGPGTPIVHAPSLRALGIEPICLDGWSGGVHGHGHGHGHGQRQGHGHSHGHSHAGATYDPVALVGAIEMILGEGG